MKSIKIDITSDCNLNCKHCILGEKSKNSEIPLTKLKEIVDTIVSRKINSILLSTTEPFYHSEFIKFLKYCRFNKVYLSLTTNGTLLNDEVITELCKGYINYLAISLEGVSSKSNDSIRGKGVFDTVIENIKKIHRYQESDNVYFPIHLQINITKDNRQEIEKEILDFLGKEYFEEVVIGGVIKLGNAELNSDFFLDYQEYKKDLEKIIYLISKSQYKNRVRFKDLLPYEVVYYNLIYNLDLNLGIPNCSLYNNNFCIMPNDKICRCNLLLDTNIVSNADLMLDIDYKLAINGKVPLLEQDKYPKKRGFCLQCRWNMECKLCLIFSEDGYIKSDVTMCCEQAFKKLEKIYNEIIQNNIRFKIKKNVILNEENGKLIVRDLNLNFVEFSNHIMRESVEELMLDFKYSNQTVITKEDIEILLYNNMLKIEV